MNCNSVKNFALLYLFYALGYNSSVKAMDDLPPILDFYPNCSYQVIENYAAKLTTEEPLTENTRLKLIKKLRGKAKAAGADALIVIDKQVIKERDEYSRYGQKSTNFSVSYKAEFIKQCEEHKTENKIPAPYDQLGFKGHNAVITGTGYTVSFAFTLPQKAELNHPKISNTELSLANGLYGVKIGTTYKDVVDTLGDPSAVLSMYKDEVVIGYGRKHWFHFRSEKLVNIQSRLDTLTPSFLNKIPLRDFFDDTPWVMSNKIVRRTPYSAVKTILGNDIELSEQKEVVIQDQDNTLTLYFGYSKAAQSNNKVYILEGFSLHKNSYKQPTFEIDYTRSSQLATLGHAFSQLNKEEQLDLVLFSHELGLPIGRITLSVDSSIDIYNSNLIVEANKSAITSIQLQDDLFNIDKNLLNNQPWFLGDFVQGKSIVQLRSYFPTDTFELGSTVQIDSDNFQLTLLFDEHDDKNTLFEAEVIIY